ncbi:MAG: hypothetical protein A2Y17_01540 [Clostridiales bacterium GWF2_38_85]|nr:MAG: hypothetical protein A2Y17_01540 [Clostridiales bacterium GWF2_38_85]
MNIKRHTYISNEKIGLVEYLPVDDKANYNDWIDAETQNGYNYNFNQTYDEFLSIEDRQCFIASIELNNKDIIGMVSISPENTVPDLAIRIYYPYRNQGYGSTAFMLATKYALDFLNIDEIYAGCYEDNEASKIMLHKCGYKPHPEGNQFDKHYLTGIERIQFDFIYKK